MQQTQEETAPKNRGGIMKSLKEFFTSDKADSVLVTTMIAMPFFMLISGFAIDIGKNMFVHDAHHSQAQSAAQSAVRNIDSTGSMTADSIVTFHNSLDRQFSGDADVAVWDGNCNIQDDATYPSYTIHFQAENYEGGTDTNRSGIFEYTAGENFDEKLHEFIVQGGIDPQQVYRVVSAEVNTSSQNIMLGMFGMPCQNYTSSVNAGTFNQL